MALLQKPPDGVVVLVREREVAAAVPGGTKLANDFARSSGFREAARQFHSHHAIAVRQRITQREQNLGVIPIAPIAQTNRLFGLPRSKREHALLAGTHKVFDAVVANLSLGLQ